MIQLGAIRCQGAHRLNTAVLLSQSFSADGQDATASMGVCSLWCVLRVCVCACGYALPPTSNRQVFLPDTSLQCRARADGTMYYQKKNIASERLVLFHRHVPRDIPFCACAVLVSGVAPCFLKYTPVATSTACRTCMWYACFTYLKTPPSPLTHTARRARGDGASASHRARIHARARARAMLRHSSKSSEPVLHSPPCAACMHTHTHTHTHIRAHTAFSCCLAGRVATKQFLQLVPKIYLSPRPGEGQRDSHLQLLTKEDFPVVDGKDERGNAIKVKHPTGCYGLDYAPLAN